MLFSVRNMKLVLKKKIFHGKRTICLSTYLPAGRPACLPYTYFGIAIFLQFHFYCCCCFSLSFLFGPYWKWMHVNGLLNKHVLCSVFKHTNIDLKSRAKHNIYIALRCVRFTADRKKWRRRKKWNCIFTQKRWWKIKSTLK